MRLLSWEEINGAAEVLATRWQGTPLTKVWGVPTGGVVAAYEFSRVSGIPLLRSYPAHVDPSLLIVDDIVDSGRTLAPYKTAGFQVDALYRRDHAPEDLAPDAHLVEEWVQFPWESTGSPEDAVVRLLQYIGEDPMRDGLRDTPKRVCRALKEMTSGYTGVSRDVVGRMFECKFDEMVIVRGIRFSSMCEHHMMPFVGTIDIGYFPGPRILGLSKLARIVEVYSKRLQVQERMVQCIADEIMSVAEAEGVGVVVRAFHSCMGCRGVLQPDAEAITSVVRGSMQEQTRKSEFLRLCLKE